jgi:ribosome-binding protein aMBF1 (putative translation factor)
MKNWNNYKEFVKSTDANTGKDLTEIETQAEIISAMIKQRNALGLSQRDLAAICNIPQSSVARIESLQTTPNLATLLKILRPLGLKLTITK